MRPPQSGEPAGARAGSPYCHVREIWSSPVPGEVFEFDKIIAPARAWEGMPQAADPAWTAQRFGGVVVATRFTF